MSMDFRSLQESLRQRLLAEIAAGDLTGLELARQIGFQQAHISNFLNRKRGLSLEAMDAILKVRKLSVAALLGSANHRVSRRKTIHAASTELTFIPLVSAENCHASELPYAEADNALTVMSSRLGRLRPKVHTPRQHWQRFVAMKVAAEDARAMTPRLQRDSTVVIDRHSNAVDEKHSIYLLQYQGRIVLRYVERAGREYVLRAESPDYPLLVLDASGRDPLAAIVGRVCLVMTEV